MGGNGITAFLFHVAQCITFNQTKFVTSTLIYKASLKLFYSRLGFKFIKYFPTSPNFEKDHKWFNYESGEYEGLQCYLTIPRHVTFLYDNRIDLHENKDVFKDLNDFPPSDDWFPFEYIDAEVKKKVEKTKGQLAGD